MSSPLQQKLHRIAWNILVVALLSITKGRGQEAYQIRTIAFYNVENLFDIENDTLTLDDDRTPNGKDRWNLERYQLKLRNLAKVISEIGAEVTHTSPDVLGLCEVENHTVLQDLIDQHHLRNKNYGIIHFDSPDKRGIDVALLFKKNVFAPLSFQSRRLLLFNEEDERNYTRDQLVVGGILDNEQFYFIVNHWPSRSGGEAQSKPNRLAAAKLNKKIIDSLIRSDPDAKIIAMGDLNDDPTDESLKRILKTAGHPKKLDSTGLYNPMERLYKKGIGSLAYRDKWNLFDQFFFTANLLLPKKEGFQFWKARVFDASYLVTKKGAYKGYPFRTYAGGNHTGGYSDHFPVYMYLIRKAPTSLPRKKWDRLSQGGEN